MAESLRKSRAFAQSHNLSTNDINYKGENSNRTMKKSSGHHRIQIIQMNVINCLQPSDGMSKFWGASGQHSDCSS